MNYLMPSMDRTSSILERLTESDTGDKVSVAEIMAGLQGRAFALFLVLLGLPNSLPMPPPIALISGFLVALLALQMILGFTAPWLPRRVLRMSVGRQALETTVKRARPYVLAMERFSRPRLAFFDTAVSMRLVGALLLLLSIAMIVAVPVIGQIPLGIAVCLIGLGLVERDGVVVIAGLFVGAIGFAISGSLALAFVLGLGRVV